MDKAPGSYTVDRKRFLRGLPPWAKAWIVATRGDSMGTTPMAEEAVLLRLSPVEEVSESELRRAASEFPEISDALIRLSGSTPRLYDSINGWTIFKTNRVVPADMLKNMRAGVVGKLYDHPSIPKFLVVRADLGLAIFGDLEYLDDDVIKAGLKRSKEVNPETLKRENCFKFKTNLLAFVEKSLSSYDFKKRIDI